MKKMVAKFTPMEWHSTVHVVFSTVINNVCQIYTTRVTEIDNQNYHLSLSLLSTIRALMEGINTEKSSQGCYKAMQLSQ